MWVGAETLTPESKLLVFHFSLVGISETFSQLFSFILEGNPSSPWNLLRIHLPPSSLLSSSRETQEMAFSTGEQHRKCIVCYSECFLGPICLKNLCTFSGNFSLFFLLMEKHKNVTRFSECFLAASLSNPSGGLSLTTKRNSKFFKVNMSPGFGIRMNLVVLLQSLQAWKIVQGKWRK